MSISNSSQNLKNYCVYYNKSRLLLYISLITIFLLLSIYGIISYPNGLIQWSLVLILMLYLEFFYIKMFINSKEPLLRLSEQGILVRNKLINYENIKTINLKKTNTKYGIKLPSQIQIIQQDNKINLISPIAKGQSGEEIYQNLKHLLDFAKQITFN